MSTLRTLSELMKADIRERTRRYSFLVTIAATLYLGYLVADGTISVHLGKYQPVPNSPWTGTAMALCTITFVALVGFYVVKNAIGRDRETGVGQILAATPVSTVLYILGKLLSNFAVLSIVTGILSCGAVILQALRGPGLDVPAIVLPFLFLVLPAMFFVAGTAVFFESAKLLRRGFGNVLYFFLYSAVIILPMETGLRSTDVFGIQLAMGEIQGDVRVLAPDYNGSFSIGAGEKEVATARQIVWRGMHWTAQEIGFRGIPVMYALALAMIAAALFDRFSSAAPVHRTGRFRKFGGSVSGFSLKKIPDRIMAPFDALLGRSFSGRMLVAEIRLMIQGLPWWWYAVALGLWIVSLAADTASSRADILPYLMIWPIFLWSGMGTREKHFRTGEMLFSAPRPLARQTPAVWGAGFLVALLSVSGILLRLALSGDGPGFLSVASGAYFVPSLALALGVWSTASKTFEAFYTAFWYVGPIHHTPSIDFLGTTDLAVSAGTPVVFTLAGTALILAALGGRRRQIRAA